MKRMKCLLAALAAMMVTLGVSAQTVDEVNAKFNEAAALVNGKKYADAIPVLNQVVEMGLKVPEAMETVTNAQKLIPVCYYMKGGMQMQSGKFDEALADFQTAAEKGELYGDPATAQKAKNWISKLYTKMAADAFNNKDYAKAAEIFAKGYAANPKDTDLALNLAKSYCEMGDTTNGYKTYREIIALEAVNPGKYKEAVDAAKADLATYMLIEASKAAEAKDYDKVYAVIGALLAVDPTSATGTMMLIQTATNQQDWAKVIANGEAAANAQTTPEMKSDAYFLLGAAYQNTENKAKAIEYYKLVTAGNNVETAKTQITNLSK